MKAKFIGDPKYNKTGSGYYHCYYSPEEDVLFNQIYDVNIDGHFYMVKMKCGKYMRFPKWQWDINLWNNVRIS